jgi:hypothetical protein
VYKVREPTEVSLSVDNDYPFMTDQYYTAGIDVGFRYLANSRIPILNNNDSSKTIISMRGGIKLFTPKDVDTQNIRRMDRPYCAWTYLGADLINFRRKNSGNVFSLEVGVVGKETGLGQLQRWLHQTINLYGIEGWDSQIANEWVVNSSAQHMHGFTLSRNAEIVSTSGAFLGTGLNKLSQEFTLRLFRFNPLRESSFSKAFLSKTKSRNEFFFFASAGADYTISNIFMQGSLFSSNPSLYTTSINHGCSRTELAFNTPATTSARASRSSTWERKTHLSAHTTTPTPTWHTGSDYFLVFSNISHISFVTCSR